MSEKKPKLYISGPMTGIPRFNHPAFNSVTALLRSHGYEVVSPVEMDSVEMREIACQSPDGKPDPNGGLAGESWGQVLGRDVTCVADQVDAVVVLPGWTKSRGARLEVFTAILCCKPVYTLYWKQPFDVTPELRLHPNPMEAIWENTR